MWKAQRASLIIILRMDSFRTFQPISAWFDVTMLPREAHLQHSVGFVMHPVALHVAEGRSRTRCPPGSGMDQHLLREAQPSQIHVD